MVRGASTAAQVWEILRNFFLRNSVHKRVGNRPKLHELKMKKGTDLMEHFFEFDEMCMKMQASGESMNLDDQLIILLGSLSDDYDIIVKIIVNTQGMDLFTAKEMLLREYEGIFRKERSECALKATKEMKSFGARRPNQMKYFGVGKSIQMENSDARRSHQRYSAFQGKCFNYNKYGHKKVGCRKNRTTTKEESAFSCYTGSHGGWILDSGASSLMCPFQNGFTESHSLNKSVLISVANRVHVEA